MCPTCLPSFPSSPGVLKPASPSLLCQTVLIKNVWCICCVLFPASLKPFVLFSCSSVPDHDKMYVKALQLLQVFQLLDTGDPTLRKEAPCSGHMITLEPLSRTQNKAGKDRVNRIQTDRDGGGHCRLFPGCSPPSPGRCFLWSLRSPGVVALGAAASPKIWRCCPSVQPVLSSGGGGQDESRRSLVVSFSFRSPHAYLSSGSLNAGWCLELLGRTSTPAVVSLLHDPSRSALLSISLSWLIVFLFFVATALALFSSPLRSLPHFCT